MSLAIICLVWVRVPQVLLEEPKTSKERDRHPPKLSPRESPSGSSDNRTRKHGKEAEGVNPHKVREEELSSFLFQVLKGFLTPASVSITSGLILLYNNYYHPLSQINT